MKKHYILTFLFFLSLIPLVVYCQNFTIGWYSPDNATYNPHRFDCVDGSPTGSFTNIGINTLLSYKAGIYQVYNGTAWPMNLSTLINNTWSYLNLYPNQKIILDIGAGTDDNPIFRSNNDVITYVNTFKNLNQINGWYIADEPEQAWTGQGGTALYYNRDALVNRYNLIKSLSQKNVYVSLANTASFRAKYGDGTISADGKPRVAKFYDILTADCYPVLIGSPWNNITACRFQAQETKSLVENDANISSNIFYFVAQGSGYNEDNNNGTGGIFGNDDPDMTQLRYMVISPMIWGAKGILFWSYANASRRGNDNPSGYPVDSWKTVHRFTQWFQASSFHASLGNIYGTTSESTSPTYDDNIHYRTKTYTANSNYAEYYIFSVNEFPQSSGSVAVPPINAPGITKWSKTAYECAYNSQNPGQSYDVPVTISSDNRIHGTWAGYEVKIFRIIYRLVAAKESNQQGIDNSTINKYELFTNFPNPFNPTTTISFNLPLSTFVSLKIFDLIGREVTTIVSEELPAGNHSRQWNAKDSPSGVYFCRFVANGSVQYNKLILQK